MQVARRFPVQIGRNAQAHLRLEDEGVWDDHARIELRHGEGFYLEAHEHALLAAVELARGRTATHWVRREYDAILPELLGMGDAIHGFFDHVMVNVENLDVRVNRLRLLADVRDLFLRGWDLSRAVVEGERS